MYFTAHVLFMRFTGLAVSAGGLAPRELPLLRSPINKAELAQEILAAARKEEATTIVIGLPVTRRFVWAFVLAEMFSYNGVS